MIDLTNKKFFHLLVIKRVENDRNKRTRWLCICDCGKEYIAMADHLTRKKNPIKSCGCQRVHYGPRHAQWGGFGEISGGWWRAHILRELSDGNRRSKIEVKIDIIYAWELFLKQDRKCALSGENIYFPKVTKESGTASLDRIDSSKGYIKGNVQWVHKHINLMKNRLTQERFIEMCKLVTNNN
jgi:hypothetical protein